MFIVVFDLQTLNSNNNNGKDSLYSNYYAYLRDARQKIATCQQACEKWSSKYENTEYQEVEDYGSNWDEDATGDTDDDDIGDENDNSLDSSVCKQQQSSNNNG